MGVRACACERIVHIFDIAVVVFFWNIEFDLLQIVPIFKIYQNHFESFRFAIINGVVSVDSSKWKFQY